jgi:hypothetical protein
MSSNINDYATPNTDYHWEDVCINFKNQQTCTSEGGPIFKSGFSSCIIVDLIMEREFRFVLISLVGIGEHEKTHQITPTGLDMNLGALVCLSMHFLKLGFMES